MPTVETDAGRVRGRRTDHGWAWLGIPYAAAPVGLHRFAAPAPPQPWPGIREATAHGPSPVQPPRRGLPATSEDCLTLNVWSPAADAARRPVLVWFYGGGFEVGTSDSPLLDGRRLSARGDVVVVTVNYRVGTLGFVDLSSWDETAHDNPGLRDCVAALRWVRDNIEGFGGDPSRVTVAGQSAGACIVTTLLGMPQARGLFHGAISHSSPADQAHSRDRGRELAERLCRLAGVRSGDVPALRALEPAALVTATSALLKEVLTRCPGLNPLAPVLGDLLPEHPYEVVRSGRGAPVPLLVGTTDDEATLFARLPVSVTPTREADLRRMLALTDPEHASAILAAYPGFPDRAPRLRLARDARYGIPGIRVAEGHSTVAPTWMFRIGFAPRLLRLLRLGAMHGIDIGYLFGPGDSALARLATALGPRRTTAAVSAALQDEWIRFLHDGTVGWGTFSPSRREVHRFDEQPHTVFDPEPHTREAWDGYRCYR